VRDEGWSGVSTAEMTLVCTLPDYIKRDEKCSKGTPGRRMCLSCSGATLEPHT
jgi:hypothetical protein